MRSPEVLSTVAARAASGKCQALRSGQRRLRNSWKPFHHLCSDALKMHRHNYTFSSALCTSAFHPGTALFCYERAVYAII